MHQHLLDAKLLIKICGRSYNTRRNILSSTTRLIKEGADVNAYDFQGIPLLARLIATSLSCYHWGMAANDSGTRPRSDLTVKLLKLFAKNHVDFNVNLSNKQTLLHYLFSDPSHFLNIGPSPRTGSNKLYISIGPEIIDICLYFIKKQCIDLSYKDQNQNTAIDVMLSSFQSAVHQLVEHYPSAHILLSDQCKFRLQELIELSKSSEHHRINLVSQGTDFSLRGLMRYIEQRQKLPELNTPIRLENALTTTRSASDSSIDTDDSLEHLPIDDTLAQLVSNRKKSATSTYQNFTDHLDRHALSPETMINTIQQLLRTLDKSKHHWADKISPALFQPAKAITHYLEKLRNKGALFTHTDKKNNNFLHLLFSQPENFCQITWNKSKSHYSFHLYAELTQVIRFFVKQGVRLDDINNDGHSPILVFFRALNSCIERFKQDKPWQHKIINYRFFNDFDSIMNQPNTSLPQTVEGIHILEYSHNIAPEFSSHLRSVIESKHLLLQADDIYTLEHSLEHEPHTLS